MANISQKKVAGSVLGYPSATPQVVKPTSENQTQVSSGSFTSNMAVQRGSLSTMVSPVQPTR